MPSAIVYVFSLQKKCELFRIIRVYIKIITQGKYFICMNETHDESRMIK